MARIVGGLGTSHSPQLSMPSTNWADRAAWDRTTPLFSFAEAAARAPQGILDELTPEAFESKYQRCQTAIHSLHEALVAMRPDVVVVVGDDQSEMFLDDGIPAIAIFRGDTLLDRPRALDSLHPSSVPAEWGYHGEEVVERPAHAALGTHLVAALSKRGVEVTQLSRQPDGRSIGHAFTYVHRRIMVDHIVPMVPIMLNTDHAPNVPTPGRCWEIGKALRAALDEWSGDERIVVVASGGLSHFEVDVDLDQHVLAALAADDESALRALSVERLVLGTSEIRNWITVGATLGQDHQFQVVDYVAVHRSEAATGCGMAFATWSPIDPGSVSNNESSTSLRAEEVLT